jgi:phytoene dehydrogenase-like protein
VTSNNYDAVIIGGGHNGLVAAAYLARAGQRVLVLERRPIVGGAAVSEHPFGPDYTVTSLSYVVSWLSPQMVRDLELVRHGYHVYPQGPYFAPRRDGRYLALPDDPAARHSPSFPRGTPTRTRAGSTGSPGSANSSARCCNRFHRSSARNDRPTCSPRPRWSSNCGAWTSEPRTT